MEEWEKRAKEMNNDKVTIDDKITALKTQAKMTVDKIKILTSEIAIKYMEEDLVKIEQQIADLLIEKEKVAVDAPTDMKMVMAYIKYYLDNMQYLLLEHTDPVIRANSFGVLFDDVPNYQEIKSGTQDFAYFIKLNEVFVQSKGKLAAEPGFEPE